MFGQFQRTRAGRGIDVIKVNDLLARAACLDQFQRDVVILISRKTGPQASDFYRKGEPHLDTRVIALEVGFIVVQRGFHHLKAEHLIRVLVETAHNAGHVDALFIRQTDRSGNRGLECQIAAVTCVEPHWQAKIRNPNMLDLLFRTADQTGRAVLQIRQRRFIIIADRKITGIVSVELRIAFDVLQQFGERRI